MHIEYLEHSLFLITSTSQIVTLCSNRKQEKDDHTDWSEGHANLGWFDIHIEWTNQVWNPHARQFKWCPFTHDIRIKPMQVLDLMCDQCLIGGDWKVFLVCSLKRCLNAYAFSAWWFAPRANLSSLWCSFLLWLLNFQCCEVDTFKNFYGELCLYTSLDIYTQPKLEEVEVWMKRELSEGPHNFTAINLLQTGAHIDTHTRLQTFCVCVSVTSFHAH